MPSYVLIADDSAVVRLSLTRRLRAEGLLVVERESAASAKTIDVATLACALLDFDLGDGDGAEVAEHLRRSGEALPIAFFTSTSDRDASARAAAYGPVFEKPSRLDEAVAWVLEHAADARA